MMKKFNQFIHIFALFFLILSAFQPPWAGACCFARRCTSPETGAKGPSPGAYPCRAGLVLFIRLHRFAVALML